MCLAVPAEIVSLNTDRATISVSGALREVDVSLIDDPRLGDHVLVHAGFAIDKWNHDDVAEWEAIRAEAEAGGVEVA